MVLDQRDFLQRSRLLSVGRLGISPVSPTVSTTYSITCKAVADLHAKNVGDREPTARLLLDKVASGDVQQSDAYAVHRDRNA